MNQSAPLPALLGRSRELGALSDVLQRAGPTLVTVTGPRGRGKTALLATALRGREALHFQAAELTEEDLLRDFQELARSVLGEVPAPLRPGVLPLGSGESGWLALLLGLVDRVEATGRPLVLALDGIDALLRARRRISNDLAEAFGSARIRKLPFCLIVAAREPSAFDFLVGVEGALGSADLAVSVPELPFRAAGWGHGGRDPMDAFLRWTLFGDDPSHFPGARPASDEVFEAASVRRILHPAGDLFDAPLRRLEATFQRPARYAAILRALAGGPLDWPGILAGAGGIESGGQLAPYLRRLEEEGLVRVELPLGAAPESRSRRYSVADPFVAFWFGRVLPQRSLLLRGGIREIWEERISPGLSDHARTWMEEAARRWVQHHAEEGLGAPAREVGSLWGEEAEFPVAGRLANGWVCFGMVDWGGLFRDLSSEMARRMAETRYGIGRETRVPLFFLAQEGDEALRRLVAREPLARIVDLEQLMGPGPEEPRTEGDR